MALEDHLDHRVLAGRLHDADLTITAVVQRMPAPKTGKWTCRILSWQVG